MSFLSKQPLPAHRLQAAQWTAGDEEQKHFAILAARFGSFGTLSEAESALLRDLVGDPQYFPPNRDFWPAGASAPAPRILVSGWACRYRVLGKGRRQIVSLILPGDFTSTVLQPRLPLSCGVVALTELDTVSAKPFVDAAASVEPVYPTFATAARMAVYHQEMLLHEQVTRLGQQSACERFAHLMLELADRLALVGLVESDSFRLPLTQEVLADTLGLSTVHVNRTVQQLRAENLIRMQGGTVTLLQREKLVALSGWTSPRQAGNSAS